MTGWGTAVIATLMLWVSCWVWFNGRHPQDLGANLMAATMIACVPAALDIAGTVFYRAVALIFGVI